MPDAPGSATPEEPTDPAARPAGPPEGLSLLVVGDITHTADPSGRLSTHAVLARQLDHWFGVMGDVTVAGHLTPWPGPPDLGPYRTEGIRFIDLPEAGGDGLRAKLAVAATMPRWALTLAREMRRADLVHLRAPCNVTLVAIPLAVVFAVNRYAIYADAWGPHPAEPRSYAIQRTMLASPRFGGVVHAYTSEDGPDGRVVANYSPVLDDAATAALRTSGTARPGDTGRLDLVCVGRLTRRKDHATVIAAVDRLVVDHGLDISLTIIGDGDQRDALIDQARRLDLADRVRIAGSLPHDQVMAALASADIHVLSTHHEGYGKVVLEAMAAGAVTVCSDSPITAVTVTPDRGCRFPAGDVAALTSILADLAHDPDRRRAMAAAGQAYAADHTLERWGDALHGLLRRRFAVLPTDGSSPDVSPAAGLPSTPRPTRDPRVGVLHVVDSLAPGGAERVAVDLVNLLDPARFRAVLAATRHRADLVTKVDDHVRVMVLGRRSTWDPDGFRRLRWLLDRFDIDIVHSHGRSSMQFVAAARVLRVLRGRPHVFHDHWGAVGIDPAMGRSEQVAARVGVDRYLGVDPRLCAWATDALGCPVDLVLNGVDLRPYAPGAPDTTLRQVLGAADDDLTVAVVAHLRPTKDHLTLLRAVARSRHRARLRVALIGDAPGHDHDRGVLDAITDMGLATTVRHLGPRDDVPALLATADIGVLSSASESGPLALLEYAAAGLPFVVTRTGSLVEALGATDAGHVVPVGDDEALAGAIDAVADRTPHERAAMGDAGRAWVAGSFDQRATAERVAAIYDDVLRR